MPTNPLVAIPVYNEEAYVRSVLEAVGEFCSHVLVIDDGSTDRTPSMLAEFPEVRVITHPENRGYGQSLASAFAFAIAGGFDWLISMDCDEQHEATQIPRFLEAAHGDQADVISGTRYPGGHNDRSNAPADRREINREITALLNQRLGLRITDAFCGFKAYRVSELSRIRITVPGYAMPMQWWVQVARAGLRVEELSVPLIYNDPTRHFGGVLDDPSVRIAHYKEVFETELASPAVAPASCCPG